jgi:predicted nuclease of predicted toxin-antitoxin system
MRFLANENFPGAAVTLLEAAGHEVVWVRTAAPGTTDPDVLAWAAREERILLTFEKDFGALARGSALPRTCGVVLLRLPMPRPSDVGQRLADLITARDIGRVTSPSSSPDGSECGRSLVRRAKENPSISYPPDACCERRPAAMPAVCQLRTCPSRQS